jgi:hypothetical protein
VITPHEFIARWGGLETFVSYDAEVVHSLAVSEETKAFLIYPGMPSIDNTFLITDNRLPTLEDAFGTRYAQDGHILAPECRHMRVLGTYENDMPAALLDDGNDGTIAQLGFDPSGNLYPIFCNSTIHQFAEFRLIFKEFFDWIGLQREAFGDDASHAFVTTVEDFGRGVALRLREVDPAVSDAVDLFWDTDTYDQSGRDNCFWSLKIRALEKGWLTNYH